jgi:pimeloyl-ACP methyl ester carboxylesterase
VVLVHGQGGGPELTWKTVIARLQAKGYQPGATLFAVDLSQTGGESEPLGLLTDAAYVAAEVRRILDATGAGQVDLVGHSRGGLIVRFLTVGDTAPLVRRAVTLNTPFGGVLPATAVGAIMDAAGVSAAQREQVSIPDDLQAGSAALQMLAARERLHPDARVPSLVIGTTWQTGVPAVLAGNDGAVPLASQLAWPGSLNHVFRLGPTPTQLKSILQSEMAPALLVWESPHLQSLENNGVIDTVAQFLLAARVPPPLRTCEPNCGDQVLLAFARAGKSTGTGLVSPDMTDPDGQ